MQPIAAGTPMENLMDGGRKLLPNKAVMELGRLVENFTAVVSALYCTDTLLCILVWLMLVGCMWQYSHVKSKNENCMQNVLI